MLDRLDGETRGYRTEKREYEDEVAKYGGADTLKKVMRGEQVS